MNNQENDVQPGERSSQNPANTPDSPLMHDSQEPQPEQWNPLMVPGTNRHKPFCSPNPTPYQLSDLSGSKIDMDSSENPSFFGQRKPHYAILHERPEHRVIIYLKAQGHSNKEVAHISGFDAVTVSNVIRQPWAITQIAEIQRKHGVDQVAEIFKTAKLKAAKALEKVIDKQDEVNEDGVPIVPASAVIAASNAILDRVYGKAKQPIDADNLANLDMSSKSDDELYAMILGGSTSTGTA